MGFKTSGTLRSHALRHSEHKPVACSKCPKRFFSNADLRKHMDVHSDTKYVCNLCGATLSSKRSLDEHRSMFYFDQRIYIIHTRINVNENIFRNYYRASTPKS